MPDARLAADCSDEEPSLDSAADGCAKRGNTARTISDASTFEQSS